MSGEKSAKWNLTLNHTTYKPMKKPAIVLALLCALAGLCLGQNDGEKPIKQISKARSALLELQANRAAEAAELLAGDLEAMSVEDGKITAEELRYHRAKALLLSGKKEEALVECEGLVANNAVHDWRAKAVFLKARILADQRKFKDALAIYEEEAGRLFSVKRKNELAREMMKFAEEMIRPPKIGELERAKPDHKKAVALLREVDEINCADEVKDEAKVKLVTSLGKLHQWKEARQEAVDYLAKFDPEWRGEFGTNQRLRGENSKGAKKGKQVPVMRYRHAEAMHRLGERMKSVRYLDELLTMPNLDPALQADATWLRLMAMTKEGGTPGDINLWAAEAKKYLAAYPKHIWNAETAFSLGAKLRKAGKGDESIAAYRDFLAGKGHAKPEAKPMTLDVESEAGFLKRVETYRKNQEKAAFEIGDILFAQKKFAQAAAQWKDTIQKFPNGVKWGDCQRGLVEIDYRQTLEEVRKIHEAEQKDPQRKVAREALEGFLSRHPLDVRLAKMLRLLGEIPYQAALELEKDGRELNDDEKKVQREHFEQAIADWKRLMAKYPNSKSAREAEVKIARIYEERFGDLEKAVTMYRRSKSGDAKWRYEMLTRKELSVGADQVFRTDEEPKVWLNLRNQEKVTVSQYWIDLESYFLSSERLQNLNKLDIDLVEPDKSWEVKVENFKKYLPMQQQVVIPFPENKPGVCVVKVNSEKLESTTFLVRSDFDLITRSGREEMLVFARNWKTNQPEAGVRLIVTDGTKVILNGKTGDDGVWHYKGDALEEVDGVRVLGVADDGIAMTESFMGDLSKMVKPGRRVHFQTGRSAYRPGETVDVTVIVRDWKDGRAVVPEAKERKFILSARTPRGVRIFEREVTLNDWGSHETSFLLPEKCRAGSLFLNLKENLESGAKNYGSQVPVKVSQRRKVELVLDLKREHIFAGEPVKGTVRATHRWGAPVVKQKLKLGLPGKLSLDLVTDEKGEAKFEFGSDGFLAGEFISLELSYPAGDALQVRKAVQVASLGYEADVMVDRRRTLVGREVGLKLLTSDPDGKPLAKEMWLEIAKLEPEEIDPVMSSVPGLDSRGQSTSLAVTTLMTRKVKTAGEDAMAEVKFRPLEAGRYQARVHGQDQFGQTVSAEVEFTVEDEKNTQKLHLFAEDKTWNEGEATGLEVVSFMGAEAPALVTVEGDELLEYRVVNLKKGTQQLSFPTNHRHAPNFRVAVMTMDDRQYFAGEHYFRVKRGLKVELEVPEGDQAPGAIISAKAKVTDLTGKPVVARVGVNLNDMRDWPTVMESLFSPFSRSSAIVPFRTAHSCFGGHQGEQKAILAAYQDESERRAAIARNDQVRQGILPQLAGRFGAGEPALITEKLKQIRIPSVDFENATVQEAIDFLRVRTREFDPEGSGINFIVREAEVEGNDDGGLGDGGLGAVSNPNEARIKSLKLENVPLATVLQYICEAAKLRYRVDEHAVVLLPFTDDGEGDIATRTFRVPNDFVAFLDDDGGGDGGGGDDPFAGEQTQQQESGLRARRSVQDLLEMRGMKFGAGAAAAYDPARGVLVVRNSLSQLELGEAIVSEAGSSVGSGNGDSTIPLRWSADVNLGYDDNADDPFADDGGQLGGGGILARRAQSIPGIPAGNGENVSNIVSGGLRSGDAAISRNSLHAILNNPNRVTRGDAREGAMAMGGRSFSVMTAADGTKEFPVNLPEEAGEWNLGVWAEKEGAMGGVEKKLMVRRPWTVSLDVASSMVVGDEILPVAMVSRSDSKGEVAGRLIFHDGEKQQGFGVKVADGVSTTEVALPVVKAVKAGEMNMAIEWHVGGLKGSSAQVVTIHPQGAPATVRRGFLAKPGKQEVKVRLAEGTVNPEMRLRFSRGVQEILKDLADVELDPFLGVGVPCETEEISGRLLAMVSYGRYLERAGRKDASARRQVADLVAALSLQIGSDGGWSGVSGRKKSDLQVSLRAYRALLEAKHFEVRPDVRVMSKARAFFEKEQPKIAVDERETRAMVQLVLASDGEDGSDFPVCNRLYRDRDRLSPQGRATLALVF